MKGARFVFYFLVVFMLSSCMGRFHEAFDHMPMLRETGPCVEAMNVMSFKELLPSFVSLAGIGWFPVQCEAPLLFRQLAVLVGSRSTVRRHYCFASWLYWLVPGPL